MHLTAPILKIKVMILRRHDPLWVMPGPRPAKVRLYPYWARPLSNKKLGYVVRGALAPRKSSFKVARMLPPRWRRTGLPTQNFFLFPGASALQTVFFSGGFCPQKFLGYVRT